MKTLVKQRYMQIPISRDIQTKNLCLRKNGQVVFEINSRIDVCQPENYQYLDMRDLLGEELDLECIPRIPFQPEYFGQIPRDESLYKEKYRPAVHFTAARGWINDPNGAIWYEGQYHLFFQHNPADVCWNNMHWGHAVSPDLIHWEEREIALFPDSLGSMYSGSAIVDDHNLTGLKETEHDVLLLFYTAAGNASRLSAEKKFTQCLAYSTDGGNTFKKYSENPILDFVVNENRDPKVIYSPELQKYVMALYLDGNEYALYTSENLTDWNLLQKVILPDDIECPDIYPLVTDAGNSYWVFSGAGDRYLIGRFENGKLNFIQPAHKLYYGERAKSYAAQSFSNQPDGRRLRIAWNQCNIPRSNFEHSMCIPVEMSLVERDGAVLLCGTPVKELESIAAPGGEIPAGALTKEGVSLDLSGKAQDITLEIETTENSVLCLSLLGLDITINTEEKNLSYSNASMPLIISGGAARIRLITDTHCVEIFAGRGQAYMCVPHVADYTLNTLKLSLKDGAARINALKSSGLENIWAR